MPAADKYDDLFTLACCIQAQALELIEEDPVLETPRYGGITHAGEGFCCDSLWVTLQPTLIEPDFQPGQDKCAYSVTERFVVTLGMPACTERNFGECDEDIEPCATDGTCPEPDHRIGGNCSNRDAPTVLQESAYVWRARSLFRRELACKVQCCAGGADGCVSVRCHSIRPVEVTTVTEGGCAYLSLTLEAKL